MLSASPRHNLPKPRLRASSLVFVVSAMLSLGLLSCAPEENFIGASVEGQPVVELAGTNWDGKSFDLSSLSGKVTVVFFGYTYCPDVCPFTLAKMQQVYTRLGEQADQFAVVFASVDPYRDSVEKLAAYVPNFDKRFFGLHMTLDEIAEIEDFYGLSVQYGQPQDGPGTDSFYYVDHTGSYFVIDGDGKLRLRHPPNATVDDLVSDIEALITG